MRTLFDEPIYRVGNWFYQRLEGGGYRVRRVRGTDWDKYGPVSDYGWKIHVTDKGVIDENTV
jgi:hypothetical protein